MSFRVVHLGLIVVTLVAAVGVGRQGFADRAARADLRTPGKLQTPHLLSNLVENPILAQLTRTAPVTKGLAESLGMMFKLIPAGEFLMGSPESDTGALLDDEKPQHRVRISRAFYLGVTEVTQGEYEQVMGKNPSRFSAGGGGKAKVAGESTERHPVERVSWHDAIKFCNALSVKDGLAPFYRIEGESVRVLDRNGPGYRLPTEAEWEYACRAGTATRYSFGDAVAGVGGYAWHEGNAEGKTHPVGQKRANAFGLYDMHGNVWEWCWDGYDKEYYRQSPGTEPSGSLQASGRVLRGGGWNDEPHSARSANRNWYAPDDRGGYLGFRVARVQSGG